MKRLMIPAFAVVALIAAAAVMTKFGLPNTFRSQVGTFEICRMTQRCEAL